MYRETDWVLATSIERDYLITEILAISWAGVRTSDFDETVSYFAEVAGLPLTLRNDEDAWAHFRLESGDLFEVFGPNSR